MVIVPSPVFPYDLMGDLSECTENSPAEIPTGGKTSVGLNAVGHASRLEMLLRHPGPALRRLAPLTAAMDRLEGAN
jgi:hypothetical protein